MSEQRVSSLLSDEPEQENPNLNFENVDQKYEELAQVMEASYSP